MIKILNIVTQPLWRDGITSFMKNYLKEVDSNEFSFGYVCPRIEEDVRQEFQALNGNIYVVNNRLKHPVSYIKKIKRIIVEDNYDIVHIHGSSTILWIELLAAKLAKCKVRIVHSHNTKTNHPILNKFFRPIFNSLYTDAFACGQEAGKWLFKKRHFTVIPNGNNVKKFKFNNLTRKKIREKYDLNNSLVLGHVGNFNDQKNHKYLIKVYTELNKKHPNKYKLVLIGSGKLFDEIKSFADSLNLENDIIFVGKSDIVNEWLQAFDIFLLPSKYEGFPFVLVEAQSAGLQCLISDVITKDVNITGLIDYISIGDDDIEKWCTKINNIKLINRQKNSDIVMEKISKAGFDIVNNAEMLQKKYKECLKNRG